jgi:hypothetical protein
MAHLKSRGPEMAKLSAPMPSFDRRTVIILLAPAGWERPCQADVTTSRKWAQHHNPKGTFEDVGPRFPSQREALLRCGKERLFDDGLQLSLPRVAELHKKIGRVVSRTLAVDD